MEKSANQNQIEIIQEKHKELITSFQNFFPLLQPLVKQKEENLKTEISSERLNEIIKNMIESADSFDIDALDNSIKELSNYKLPLDFSQKFDKISQSVQNVDFKELRNLLSEWSNK